MSDGERGALHDGGITAAVQLRGSIPLVWGHGEQKHMVPRPDIHLQSIDPVRHAAAAEPTGLTTCGGPCQLLTTWGVRAVLDVLVCAALRMDAPPLRRFVRALRWADLRLRSHPPGASLRSVHCTRTAQQSPRRAPRASSGRWSVDRARLSSDAALPTPSRPSTVALVARATRSPAGGSSAYEHGK